MLTLQLLISFLVCDGSLMIRDLVVFIFVGDIQESWEQPISGWYFGWEHCLKELPTAIWVILPILVKILVVEGINTVSVLQFTL